jgi:hypothetical protein
MTGLLGHRLRPDARCSAQQIGRNFGYTDRKLRLRACAFITAFIPLWRLLWRFSNSRFQATLFSGSTQLLGSSAAIIFLPTCISEVEAEILDRVGTYGKQLGQITDAMIVLLKHLPDRESLTRKESDVIKAFEKMANEIANIKEKHKRQAVRP